MNNLLLSFLSKKKAALFFTSLLFLALFFVGFATNTAYSQNFRTTWITDDGTIKIPTAGTGYNYTVTWTNLDNTGVGNGSATAQTGNYTITGLENDSRYEVAISGDFPRFYMNNVFQEKLKLKTIEEWGNIAWQTMEKAFYGCMELTYNATDVPNLSSVTDLTSMFEDCRSFDGNATMNNWNTSTITLMKRVFKENFVFNQDISNWNTENVTEFGYIFSGAALFNQDISTWNTSSATRMNYMFHEAASFNQPIGNWDISNVTDLGDMFRGAVVFNQDIGDWNTEKVTGLARTFEGAVVFNQDISRWNTDVMVNMDLAFSNAQSFNQDISAWNMSNVRNMNSMFDNAISFNQDISSWDTGEVVSMFGTFQRALSFNQDISNWNTENVTVMSNMFDEASSFDQNLGTWNITSITGGMANMLDYSNLSVTNLDATLIGWASQNVNTGIAIGLYGLTYCAAEDAVNYLDTVKDWNFITPGTYSCSSFRTKWVTTDGTITIPTNGTGYNYDITWLNLTNPGVNEGAATNQTGNYTLTGLENGSTYDIAISGDFPHFYMNGNVVEGIKLKTIESWGSIAWTSMANAFEGCSVLTYSANDVPNLSAVTNMSAMFANCNAFDGNATMNNWSVDNVDNMQRMFDHAFVFNQPLNGWNTENVTNMSSMFSAAYAFNQPLNGWNTANVTDMNSMFISAFVFNQPLNDWNTSSVTDMRWMFSSASAFNQPLNNWNTANVTSMFSTFELAIAFDQSLASWDITGVTQVDFLDGMGAMLNQTALSESNYDATLLAWSVQNVNPNIKLGANGLNYCTAEAARSVLTSAPNGWIITGDNLVCSPTAFRTTWITTNGSITIPTNGTGYDYTVTWTNLTNTGVGNGSITSRTGNYTITGLENGSTYQIDILGDFPHFYMNNNTAERAKIRSIEQWGNTIWRSMSAAFYGCENLTYNATDIPDLSEVTLMTFMFAECDIFEGNNTINNWDISNVTNIAGVFNQTLYNSPLHNWNTSNVTNMFGVFFQNRVFNQPIGNWNVSNVTNFEGMFQGATSFNQPLNDWNTQSATRTMSTFAGSAYNYPLYNWNMQNVTRMDNMFASNSVFNQNINTWNISNVTNLSGMFFKASSFNEPINNWNTSSVTNMQYMFQEATSFNKDIGNWNTERVVTMGNMFNGATSFNQSLASWDIEAVVQSPLNANGGMINMLSNSGMDISNYDETLTSWAAQNVNLAIKLGATGLKYCSAEAARNTLVSTKNWIITGDTFEANCSASDAILPSTQMAKLLASGATTYHGFGHTVDISGDYAIVGAYGDATGSQNTREAAYIYKRIGSQWIQQARLTGRDETREDQFGYSVSISENYAVVGAYADDRNGELTGVVYVFKRNGTNWTQHAILETDTPQTRVLFGWSVSISEDYIAVGASQENANGISSAGLVYIFKNTGASWTQEAKLIASDAEASDEMGRVVSIFGDYVIAGAAGEDTGGTQTGAAYIFKRNGTTWTQQAKVQASDAQANDNFGYSVSMADGYALVGTNNSNGAYVFKQDGATWTQQTKLVTNDMNAFRFGNSVAISNERAVVGAHRTTTANGLTGAAYLFKRDGAVWTEQQPLLGRNLQVNDEFGGAVAVEGSYAIIGTYGDDESDTEAGAAYIFSYPEINLKGNNIDIVDGDTSPSTSDSTDFGAVRINKTVRYIIQNIGQSGLKISSINISGANASEFIVSNFVNDTIINGESSMIFDVTLIFNSASLGIKTATISINNEDADESIYDFAIKATTIPTSSFFVKTNGGDDTNTGADFDNAFATLEKALSLSSLGTQIYVAKGTYIPTQGFDFDTSRVIEAREVAFKIPDGVEVYGGFVGTETTITPSVINSRDFSTNETILTGDLNGDDVVTGATTNLVYNNYTENAYHVVYTKNVSDFTIVDGFTITGGHCNGSFDNGLGAGIYNVGDSIGNRSNPVFYNLIITKNLGAIGVGMFNDGARQGNASPILKRCQFIQNKATTRGAGMFNSGSSGTSTPLLDNCYFSQNVAVYYGGGMENFGFAGISNPTIMNTYFYQNRADRGAGIHNEGENGQSNAKIINCIFMDNAVTGIGYGGAVYNNGRSGVSNATIINSTFFKNRSDRGASIYSDGTTGESNSEIINSIFWKNEGILGKSFHNLRANTTISYSLVQEANENGLTSPIFSLTTIGGGMIYGQDPLFVDELNWNLDIQACSPAINVGTNAPINNLGTISDIIGNSRILTNTVDMGAVEFNPDFNPQINVKGNGVDIADNDLTPSTTDDTDFGSIVGQRTITYTIQNTGTTLLAVSSIEVTGTNASEFVVNGFSGNTDILAGNSLTFDVTYTPIILGTSTAMITINNGDCSQSEYNFAIRGTNALAPEINVQGNGIDIVNNDVTTTTTNATDFGSVLACNSDTLTRIFTIQNTAAGNLAINNITVSGTDASAFALGTFTSTVAGFSSTTFTVTFDASRVGFHTATIQIETNDADENPYTYVIEATGTADNINPVVPTLADQTAQCEVTSLTPPTTTDNCAGTLIGTTTQVFPITTNTVVEWTFDDGNGNIITANQNVIIADTQAPIVPTLADETAQCEVTSLTPPTTTDNCAGILTGTTPQVFPITTQGTTVVEWTFDDGNGNIVTANQNVIITLDTQAPTITVPALVTVNTDTGICTASNVALGIPTGTDNCGTVTFTNDAPTIFSIGTTTVTWTANDGNGNTATATQDVVISDMQAPTITAPAPVTTNTDTGICTASNLALGTPTGTDNCGTVTFINDAPTIFPIGTTTVTWTANDGNGNTATATQTVTITAPVEINILGNAVSITDGATIPSLGNDTDFGDVLTTKTVTYTIENTGTQPLLISSITSTNPKFVVSVIPSSVPATGTATFNVEFSSTTLGLETATITVNNNDCDESVYDFAIQATKVSTTPPPNGGGVANPDLTGTSTGSSGRVALSWTPNSSVTSYRLYRDGVLIGVFSGSVNSFSDDNLSPNTLYMYQLIAVINGTESAPSTLMFWTNPAPPTVGLVTDVCQEGMASITISSTGSSYKVYQQEIGGNAITQSGNSTFNLPSVSSQTDFYVSTISAESGKESQRTRVTVNVQPTFEASIVGQSTQSSCTNSLALQAESIANATYTWMLNGNEVGTGQTFMAGISGNYKVRIEKGVCQVVSSQVQVLLNQVPTAQIQEQRNGQSTVTFCENGMLNATALTGNTTYKWLLNANVVGENQNVSVSQSGIYTLVVSKNGCEASTEIDVVIAPRPQMPNLVATQRSLCQDDKTTLTIENVENGVTYKWLRNGREIRETGTTIEVSTAGNYTVKVVSGLENSCMNVSEELQINRFEVVPVYLRENNQESKLYVESSTAQNQITNIEWYFEGEFDASLGSQSEITPTEEGNYSALVTNQNGCRYQTRVVYFSIDSDEEGEDGEVITGEEDIKADTFKIYPNPSNGIFKVAFETVLLENTEVTIFDGIGRKIHTQTFEKGNQKFSIDLKNQPKGMYLIHFNQNGATYSKQIIIE